MYKLYCEDGLTGKSDQLLFDSIGAAREVAHIVIELWDKGAAEAVTDEPDRLYMRSDDNSIIEIYEAQPDDNEEPIALADQLLSYVFGVEE